MLPPDDRQPSDRALANSDHAGGCEPLGSNFLEFVKGIKYDFSLHHSDLNDTAYFISAALGDC